MRSDTTEPLPSDEPTGFELRKLRRLINRHRRRHEQAERRFRDWRKTWSVNESVIDEQLTRIGNQLTNRLRRQAELGAGSEGMIEN
jgi:hypothetical protein